MGVENLQTISFRDVLAKYEGRIYNQTAESMPAREIDIPDKKAFLGKIMDASKRMFKDLVSVDFEDNASYIKDDERSLLKRFSSYEVIDPTIPITLIAYKIFNKIKADGTIHCRYKLCLINSDNISDHMGDASDLICEAFLIDMGDWFDLPHREVLESFRNQGFGRYLLSMVESFVLASSNDLQQSQLIKAKSGQLDVMVWLMNAGFVPATEDDRLQLDKVLDAENGFSIGKWFYVFDPSVSRDERIEAENDRNISIRKSFRINFVKKVDPSENPVTNSVARNVRLKVVDGLQDRLAT